MLSEALNFYSGGFWDIGGNPFEALFAIRDISGNAITMIAVSLPKTFANVTRSALGRLTFFIAMAGIVLVIPIFWFQSYVLLNPLTKMTEEIRKLSNVPVVFVSSASDDMGIVMAINMGGDDFITKPFSMNVLTAKEHSD